MKLKRLVKLADIAEILEKMRWFCVGYGINMFIVIQFHVDIGLMKRIFEILSPRMKTRYSKTALRFPNVIHEICSI